MQTKRILHKHTTLRQHKPWNDMPVDAICTVLQHRTDTARQLRHARGCTLHAVTTQNFYRKATMLCQLARVTRRYGAQLLLQDDSIYSNTH